MVVVRTCCCGCTLAQGTVGTGILSTVEAILYFGLGALYLGQQTNEKGYESANNFIKIMGIALLVQGALILIGSICLFCAVQTKRRPLLLPWLIIRGILLALGILGCIAILISGANFLMALGQVLWISLMIYLFLVVVSYYQSDMERTNPGGQILAPAPGTVFTPVPQQPDNQYKPPYAMTNVPPPGTTVYAYPPNASSSGPPVYPTHVYSFTPQGAPQPYGYPQPHGAVQPPPYPSEPQKKGDDVQQY